MIFVDTSAWFAVYSSRDVNHPSAHAYLRQAIEPLVTPDYVVDETLTLLRVKGFSARAAAFGRRIFDERSIHLVKVTESDLERAWAVFRMFDDKGWSFTDCTSFAVIERLGIKRAFAFDHHFQQFGLVVVQPTSTGGSTEQT